VGWRLAIVAAGPLCNVLFAVLAYYVVLVGWGVPTLTTQVGDVMAGKPAALAGVHKDDKVLAINGKPMRDWVHMVKAIQGSGGRPVHMVLQRGRQEITLTVKPNQVEVTDIFGDKHQIYRVGIMASQDVFNRPVGLWDGVGLAFKKTYMAGELIIMSVVKIIQAKVSVDNIGGPIMIAQVAGQAASHGLGPFLNFVALISVNLAILNLLPIPALDGGHIFFFLIEAVTRRPVSRKVREKAQQVGMAILMLLMVFVFYNDIARLLGGSAQ
jgi:regulator of sigma E protease